LVFALAVVPVLVAVIASFQVLSGVMVLIVLGGLGILVCDFLAFRAWLAHRERQINNLRGEVSRLVKDVILDVRMQPDGSTANADLEAEVVRRLGAQTASYERRRYWERASGLVSPEEVRRRLQLEATTDEKALSSATQVILELLPPIPRTVKRLFNRLYFLLVVAYSRDLIERGGVTVEQLAKWAVLFDRWPQAGKAINENPQLVQALEEKASNEDEFAKLCSAYAPPLASDLDSFRDFFLSEHKLAPAAYYLVYLDGDVKPPEATDTPESRPAADDTAPEPAEVALPDGLDGRKASVIS
jgi:hypothetical protein